MKQNSQRDLCTKPILLNQIIIDYKWLPLLAITMFFLINSLFNSLATSYGFNSYLLTSMLFIPGDIHADLIKYALSFSVYDPNSYISSWPAIYQDYYQNNPYRDGSHVVATGMPISVSLALVINKLIFAWSPSAVVIVFYVLVFFTVIVFYYFMFRDLKKVLLVASITYLSYVSLFILTRGHIYSFIASVLLMTFILSVMNENKFWIISILAFAILINFRPNAIIFAPLFLAYGVVQGGKYLLISIMLAILTWLIFGMLVQLEFPSFEIFNFFSSVSTIFTTYHMFFLYVFLIYYLRFQSLEKKSLDLVIIITVIFLLLPKNYFYINGVSIETFLNPLVLLISFLYISSTVLIKDIMKVSGKVI